MESNQVVAINGTSEPLKRVIVGVADLHVINFRIATYRTKGDTIDFLIRLEGETSKLHTYIRERTRAVSIVISAMLRARTTLNLLFGLVILSLTTDDEASPVARTTLSLRHLRGKYDRLLSRALCIQFATTLYDKRCLRIFVAKDNRTRLDSKYCAICDIYPTAEEVFAFFKCLNAGEDKLIIAIADRIAKQQIISCTKTAIFAPVAGVFYGFFFGFTCHEGGCHDGRCHQKKNRTFHRQKN